MNTETRDDATAIVDDIQHNNGVATGEQIYELIQTLNIGTYVNSPNLAYTCLESCLKSKNAESQPFSAPANLRYGHSLTNAMIQDNFDPMTCGMGWSDNNNINNCQNGMTIKERDLLALVFPGQAWNYRLVIDANNPGVKYYCTNCPTPNENLATGTKFWYLEDE